MGFVTFLKVLRSPYYWAFWAVLIVCFYCYKQGYNSAMQEWQDIQQKQHEAAEKERVSLQKALKKLTEQSQKKKRERKIKTQQTVKEINQYVDDKETDSPCFVDLDSVRLLDELCQKTASCTRSDNTLPVNHTAQ